MSDGRTADRSLRALADPTRAAILRRLLAAPDGRATVGVLAAELELQQPTVSHHLRVLREAGLIHGERRGTWIWYRLDPSVADRLAAIAGELSPGVPRPASALGSPPESTLGRVSVVVRGGPASVGGRG